MSNKSNKKTEFNYEKPTIKVIKIDNDFSEVMATAPPDDPWLKVVPFLKK